MANQENDIISTDHKAFINIFLPVFFLNDTINCPAPTRLTTTSTTDGTKCSSLIAALRTAVRDIKQSIISLPFNPVTGNSVRKTPLIFQQLRRSPHIGNRREAGWKSISLSGFLDKHYPCKCSTVR